MPDQQRPPMPPIPPSGRKLSAQEVGGLLQSAIEWAEHLNKTVEAAFPGAVDPLRLDGLTLDQKMALGEKAAADLLAVAYRVNPLSTLDGLERDLAEHAPSQDEAAAAIVRARRASG